MHSQSILGFRHRVDRVFEQGKPVSYRSSGERVPTCKTIIQNIETTNCHLTSSWMCRPTQRSGRHEPEIAADY